MISKISKISNLKKGIFSIVSLGSIGYIITNEDKKVKVKNFVNAGYRISNLVYTVGVISIDYTYSINQLKKKYDKTETSNLEKEIQKLAKEQETYTFNLWKAEEDNKKEDIIHWRKLISLARLDINRLSEELGKLRDNKAINSNYHILHERNAIRLRDMCAQNKGIYIKLGQHLAMLDYMFPAEYQEYLSTLLGSAPISSIDSVRRVIHDQLGKYPEEIWEKFDEKPVASASLAQVHIAYNKGIKYAIKVQHEGLKEGSEWDMYVVTILVDLLSKAFEGFDYNWLSKEMNENLPLELNFSNEGFNIINM